MSIVAVAERGLFAAGSRGRHKISGNVIASCLRHRPGQADRICITRHLRDIAAIVGRWVVSRYRAVIDAADIRVELAAIRSRYLFRGVRIEAGIVHYHAWSGLQLLPIPIVVVLILRTTHAIVAAIVDLNIERQIEDVAAHIADDVIGMTSVTIVVLIASTRRAQQFSVVAEVARHRPDCSDRPGRRRCRHS